MFSKRFVVLLQVLLVMSGILVMVIVANYYMAAVIAVLALPLLKLRQLYTVTTKNVKHLEGIGKWFCKSSCLLYMYLVLLMFCYKHSN